MSTAEKIKTALIDLDVPGVQGLVRQGLDEGAGALFLLEEGLIAGMNVIGRRFKEGEVFMPEVLVAAKAMHAGLDLLKPFLAGSGNHSKGKVIMGTVQGDLHDIGKNLVIIMLAGAGFEVVDLGVDVPPEGFIAAIESQAPQVVALSTLLTSTMPQLHATVQRLEPYRGKVRIIIGGAPVTQTFADRIGADGYAPDAPSAVEKIREWMAEREAV